MIEGAETLAEAATNRALADAAIRGSIFPCVPTGPADDLCLRAFIRSFGKRVFRRALADDEVARYAALGSYSTEDANFDTGAGLVMRAMLQHPRFLYRLERPVASGALDGYDIAARLSFLIWGSIPDEALLAQAEGGTLLAPEGRRAAAARMLLDPRAVDRWDQFHAFWLGYFQLPLPASLTVPMRAESRALVQDVIFDRRADYSELFLSTRTRIGDDLAAHYSLPLSGTTAPTWVDYGTSGRRGILSQGSVLAAFSKFADTSPTRRGLFIRTRLLCGEIAPPPPTVNVDQPPPLTGSPCKVDRYAAHRSNAGCASCHSQMDPIGFGLENYDKTGKYREVEPNLPQCAIAGKGEVTGVGTFRGPAELAGLLTSSGRLESCVARQVYRFAIGRKDTPDEAGNVAALARSLGNKRALTEMLLDLAGSDAMAMTGGGR